MREEDEAEDWRPTRKAKVKAREGRGEQWHSEGHQQEAGTAAGALSNWKSWNSSRAASPGAATAGADTAGAQQWQQQDGLTT
eukprot:690381-Pyramimonas_sp.AAC.1